LAAVGVVLSTASDVETNFNVWRRGDNYNLMVDSPYYPKPGLSATDSPDSSLRPDFHPKHLQKRSEKFTDLASRIPNPSFQDPSLFLVYPRLQEALMCGDQAIAVLPAAPPWDFFFFFWW
jgi:hypothetical protein